MRKFVLGLMGLMGLIGLVGCKATKVIEQVPVYIHDTTQTVRELHDSIYIDRWHTEYQKGDTIYITDEVTKIVTKIKIDTAYKYVEKPVTISKTETVEVEEPLTWLQKTLMGMGVVGLMGLMGLIGWRVLKRKFLPRA
jgi:hypothetical protein